jgi:hypothetical protein
MTNSLHNSLPTSTPASFMPSPSTQAKANLIVHQIEREFATQLYEYAHSAQPTHPRVLEFETPASVASRIFYALRSFARSA